MEHNHRQHAFDDVWAILRQPSSNWVVESILPGLANEGPEMNQANFAGEYGRTTQAGRRPAVISIAEQRD